MRRNRILRVARIAAIGIVAVAVVSAIVMQLWNWLIPAIIGWHTITFWQALGLLVLSKILFGSFRGRPGYRAHWRRRMMERWEQMTPEQREKFQEAMRARCGAFDRTAPESTAPRAL